MPRYSHFTELMSAAEIQGRNAFYLPNDPLLVYTKLLKVFLKGRGREVQIKHTIHLDKKDRLNLFRNLIRSSDFHYPDKINDNHDVLNFCFIKWLMQEIPSEFYLYSSLIEANRKKLEESAAKSSLEQVWIDTPKVKNKIKMAKLTDNVIDALIQKKLVLPTYNEICKQVFEWGNKTVYNFGIINESEKVVLR